MKKAFFIVGLVIELTLLPTLVAAQVTDIDGNVYKTVKIGNQTWMAEDLRVTKYNDRTAVPLVRGNNERSMLTTGAYCYSDNNITDTSKNIEYNWYAVITGKLCPTGWHIPTDIEWDTLVFFLGGATVAGGKLKEAGTNHWNPPNYGADNSSGFTALPETVRTKGLMGVWWSTTEYSESEVWIRSMTYKVPYVVKINFPKSADGQVRCLKD
jgi:uncharacterized protein (TIGR02145 family)